MTRAILPLLMSFLLPGPLSPAFGQTADSAAEQKIRYADSTFWVAYNSCDVAGMMKYFTTDIEFYHDKGGITLGVSALGDAMQRGICNPADSSTLRRELVPGSTRVFLMKKAGVIYGAVFSGDHTFHVTANGQKERPVGIAKFTHLWLLQDSEWKMARVLSFDHQPAGS